MTKQNTPPQYDMMTIPFSVEQGQYIRERAEKEYRSLSSIVRMLVDQAMSEKTESKKETPRP